MTNIDEVIARVRKAYLVYPSTTSDIDLNTSVVIRESDRDALLAALEEAREDSKRLNWLAGRYCPWSQLEDLFLGHDSETIRAAIDKARGKE